MCFKRAYGSRRNTRDRTARRSRAAPSRRSLCVFYACILHWYILGDHAGRYLKHTILGEGIKMKAKESKRIIYRYNGDPSTDELIKDTQYIFPRVGEIVNRRGKDWKVVVANEDFNFSGPTPYPILRVFLTDNF
jgi:hypothetical protein